MLAAFSATAQNNGFQFPYNPDAEPDGFIGVQDVLSLLQLYGAEWDAGPSFFDSDSTTLLVDMGAMNYVECLGTCSSMPGAWKVPTLEEISRHYIQLKEFEDVAEQYWLNRNMWRAQYHAGGTSHDNAPIIVITAFDNSAQNESFAQSWMFESAHHCACFTKERPKVEYVRCVGNGSQVSDCCQEKVQNGWYPLGNPTVADGGVSATHVQAFWRWED